MSSWHDLTRAEQDAFIIEQACSAAAPELTHEGWRNRIEWNQMPPEGPPMSITRTRSSDEIRMSPRPYYILWVWRDAGGVRAQIRKRPE